MTIAIITTGGTIASGRGDAGAVTPGSRGHEAVRAALPADVRVRPVMSMDSSAMTLADAVRIRTAVAAELAIPDTTGIVVLHGTDTLEETAMLLDAYHDDPRPVVLTGAQRPADHPDPDGPANIAQAVAAARTGSGVRVVFGGADLPARGTVKAHTTDLAGFAPTTDHDPDDGPLPWSALPWNPLVADVRVDIVTLHPGIDRTLIDSAVAAGAAGIVLAGMGSGNGNPAVTAAVADAVAAGVAVVLTSRVARGPVQPIYGGSGGGFDLRAAGAIPATALRAGQARVLLAALLADGAGPARLASAFDAGAPATVGT